MIPAFTVPAWQSEAPCAGMDPDVFVPEDEPFDGEAPPAVCFECPLRDKCLEYGLKTESEGWWGGVYLKLEDEHPEVTEHVTDHALRYKLYYEGLSDQAIATRVGLARSNIRAWRMLRDLPRNGRPTPTYGTDEERMKLYRKGFTDEQIAAAEGGTVRSTIRSWRGRRGLPANGPRGGRRKPA